MEIIKDGRVTTYICDKPDKVIDKSVDKPAEIKRGELPAWKKGVKHGRK